MTTYLVQDGTGDRYVFSPQMAKRSDMQPLDVPDISAPDISAPAAPTAKKKAPKKTKKAAEPAPSVTAELDKLFGPDTAEA